MDGECDTLLGGGRLLAGVVGGAGLTAERRHEGHAVHILVCSGWGSRQGPWALQRGKDTLFFCIRASIEFFLSVLQ